MKTSHEHRIIKQCGQDTTLNDNNHTTNNDRSSIMVNNEHTFMIITNENNQQQQQSSETQATLKPNSSNRQATTGATHVDRDTPDFSPNIFPTRNFQGLEFLGCPLIRGIPRSLQETDARPGVGGNR